MNVCLVKRVETENSKEKFYLKMKLCIINSVGKIFPKRYHNEAKTRTIKKSFALAFSRLIELINTDSNFKDNFFVDSLMEHMVIVWKLTLDDIHAVNIMFETLRNKLDPSQVIKELERITGIMVRSILYYENLDKEDEKWSKRKLI